MNLTKSEAEYLQKQLGLSQDETEVIRYGMQAVFYSLAGILTICFIGWLLGCFWTTVTVALTAGSLRLLSGGAHSSSAVVCNLVGMVVAPLLAKTAEFAAKQVSQPQLLLIIISGALFSLLIFYLLAPVDSAAKPISSEHEQRKFKYLTLTLASFLFVVQIALTLLGRYPAFVLAMSLGSCWQAFTLTKAGHIFAAKLDHLLIRRC